jgi:hypothetical protein
MAYKVSGTTVINNSRALNNITGADAATIAALNTAGVGGGGTINLQMDSGYSASKGDAVGLDPTGRLKTVSSLMGPYDDTATLSEYNYGSGGDRVCVRFNSDRSKICMVWYVSGGYSVKKFFVVTGTINSSTGAITWGSKNHFDTMNANWPAYIDLVHLSGDLFAFMYNKYNGGRHSLHLRAVSVSGTTHTLGSANNFHTTAGTGSSRNHLSRVSNSSFLIGYAHYDGSFYKQSVRAATVSGTTITVGSQYTTTNATDSQAPAVAYNPNNGKFVADFRKSDGNTLIQIGTISGTTISMTETLATGYRNTTDAIWLDDDHVMVSDYKRIFSVNASNQATYVATGVSPTSAQNILTSWPGPNSFEIYNGKLYYVSWPASVNPVFHTASINISTGKIQGLAQLYIDNSTGDFASTDTNPNKTHWYPYMGSGDFFIDDDGVAIVSTYAIYNNYSWPLVFSVDINKDVTGSIIGLANENISAGSTGEIAITGGTVTGLTGIAPGTRYKVNSSSGGLQITGSTDAEAFAIGLSSTSLLVT